MVDRAHMKKVLQRAKNDKVFFAENFLQNLDGENYT